MQVLKENVYGVHRYDTWADFWEEEDDDGQRPLESKSVIGGVTISIMEEEGPPVPVLRTEREATISCFGFGDGFTSDHWLVIQEEGATECWAIYNEPIDESDDDEEIILRLM